MPITERRDGTLWININEMSDVVAVQRKLVELGVPVAAVIADPACGVVVREVPWSGAYPEIVPRNGPEPGIIVDPNRIPDGHTLLLETRMMTVPGRDPETVGILYLIEGDPPDRVARVIGRPLPLRPRRVRLPKPPPRL